MDCTLLLVDPEPDTSAAMQRALQADGYQIFCADSATRALELMHQHDIDVVVSDNQIVDPTNTQLLSKVRTDFPHTVRIMLSGHADIEAVIQAVNEGSIYKFLTKPWSNDNLRCVIKEAAAVARTTHSRNPDSTLQLGFSDSCRALNGPARLVSFEIKNASASSILSQQQKQLFVNHLNERCTTLVGELLVPITAIEGSILAMVTKPQTHAVMRDLAHSVSQPYFLDGQIAPLRLALGYADSDKPADDVEWLRRSLIALTATNFAGEVTAFTSEIQTDLHERHSIESDMLDGLAHKEFFLQLQPQVCGQTLAIKGAEALCRWLHPTRGLVSPLQFIDMAEENGFIHDLGAWVIKESCCVAGLLRRRNINDVKVSFNVSPRQFALPGWTELVARFAVEENIDPQNLEVEITESTVMDDPEQALRIMSELKRIGVCLAMDDFGTGHSSLALLKDLPVDVLKFDRSLISSVESDERSRTMFIRLVEMAHELGLGTIAEGVESEGQVSLCQDVNCGMIQGFAFYKPVAVGEFFQLLEGSQGARH